MKLLKQLLLMGGLRRVQMGGLGGRYGGIGCLLMGTEMVSSIVMYTFGGGPRGDPMNLAF